MLQLHQLVLIPGSDDWQPIIPKSSRKPYEIIEVLYEKRPRKPLYNSLSNPHKSPHFAIPPSSPPPPPKKKKKPKTPKPTLPGTDSGPEAPELRAPRPLLPPPGARRAPPGAPQAPEPQQFLWLFEGFGA